MKHLILAAAVTSAALFSTAGSGHAGVDDDTIRIASPWKIGLVANLVGGQLSPVLGVSFRLR